MSRDSRGRVWLPSDPAEQRALEPSLDGAFLGRGNNNSPARIYPSSTDPLDPTAKVQGFIPSATAHTGAQIVFVNGILTDAKGEAEMAQALADVTGAEVVGLHNATTYNVAEDLAQCATDKLNQPLQSVGLAPRNAATESIKSMVERAIDAGEPINLFGHSQGGLLISSALKEVTDDLASRGLEPDAVQSALSLVHVQTFGAAAYTYPPGPDYYHHVNLDDLVPNDTGLGWPGAIGAANSLIEHLGPDLATLGPAGVADKFEHGGYQDFESGDGGHYQVFSASPPWNPTNPLDYTPHSPELSYFPQLAKDQGALAAIYNPAGPDAASPAPSAEAPGPSPGELHSQLLGAFIKAAAADGGRLDPVAGAEAVMATAQAIVARDVAGIQRLNSDLDQASRGITLDTARFANNLAAAGLNAQLASLGLDTEEARAGVEVGREAVRSVIDTVAHLTGSDQPNPDLIALSNQFSEWGRSVRTGLLDDPYLIPKIGAAMVTDPIKLAEFAVFVDQATPGTALWFAGMASDPQRTTAMTVKLTDEILTAAETLATNPAQSVAQLFQLDKLTSGNVADYLGSTVDGLAFGDVVEGIKSRGEALKPADFSLGAFAQSSTTAVGEAGVTESAAAWGLTASATEAGPPTIVETFSGSASTFDGMLQRVAEIRGTAAATLEESAHGFNAAVDELQQAAANWQASAPAPLADSFAGFDPLRQQAYDTIKQAFEAHTAAEQAAQTYELMGKVGDALETGHKWLDGLDHVLSPREDAERSPNGGDGSPADSGAPAEAAGRTIEHTHGEAGTGPSAAQQASTTDTSASAGGSGDQVEQGTRSDVGDRAPAPNTFKLQVEENVVVDSHADGSGQPAEPAGASASSVGSGGQAAPSRADAAAPVAGPSSSADGGSTPPDPADSAATRSARASTPSGDPPAASGSTNSVIGRDGPDTASGGASSSVDAGTAPSPKELDGSATPSGSAPASSAGSGALGGEPQPVAAADQLNTITSSYDPNNPAQQSAMSQLAPPTEGDVRHPDATAQGVDQGSQPAADSTSNSGAPAAPQTAPADLGGADAPAPSRSDGAGGSAGVDVSGIGPVTIPAADAVSPGSSDQGAGGATAPTAAESVPVGARDATSSPVYDATDSAQRDVHAQVLDSGSLVSEEATHGTSSGGPDAAQATMAAPDARTAPPAAGGGAGPPAEDPNAGPAPAASGDATPARGASADATPASAASADATPAAGPAADGEATLSVPADGEATQALPAGGDAAQSGGAGGYDPADPAQQVVQAQVLDPGSPVSSDAAQGAGSGDPNQAVAASAGADATPARGASADATPASAASADATPAAGPAADGEATLSVPADGEATQALPAGGDAAQSGGAGGYDPADPAQQVVQAQVLDPGSPVSSDAAQGAGSGDPNQAVAASAGADATPARGASADATPASAASADATPAAGPAADGEATLSVPADGEATQALPAGGDAAQSGGAGGYDPADPAQQVVQAQVLDPGSPVSSDAAQGAGSGDPNQAVAASAGADATPARGASADATPASAASADATPAAGPAADGEATLSVPADGEATQALPAGGDAAQSGGAGGYDPADPAQQVVQAQVLDPGSPVSSDAAQGAGSGDPNHAAPAANTDAPQPTLASADETPAPTATGDASPPATADIGQPVGEQVNDGTGAYDPNDPATQSAYGVIVPSGGSGSADGMTAGGREGLTADQPSVGSDGAAGQIGVDVSDIGSIAIGPPDMAASDGRLYSDEHGANRADRFDHGCGRAGLAGGGERSDRRSRQRRSRPGLR